MAKRPLWLCIGMLLLSACQPAVLIPTPAPTQVIFSIQLTPGLSWLRPAFTSCADLSSLGLLVEEIPFRHFDLQLADVGFKWGGELPSQAHGFEISSDQLVVIVNPENQAASLRLEQLQNIYTGKIDNWSEFDPESSSAEIHFWVNSSQEEAADAFVNTMLNEKSSDIEAYEAPHPTEMRAAIAADSASIGYLPARWVDSSVRVIPISDQPESPQIPVIALTTAQPEGDLQDWLLCVQNQASNLEN